MSPANKMKEIVAQNVTPPTSGAALESVLLSVAWQQLSLAESPHWVLAGLRPLLLSAKAHE